MEHYLETRKKAMTESNIVDGWRETGLFPLNIHRILHQISGYSTSSSSQNLITSTPFLINSSSSEAIILRSVNATFNTTLTEVSISSPIRNHRYHLSEMTEKLYAKNIILERENSKLKIIIRKRKKRMSDKDIRWRMWCWFQLKQFEKHWKMRRRIWQSGVKKGQKMGAKERINACGGVR